MSAPGQTIEQAKQAMEKLLGLGEVADA